MQGIRTRWSTDCPDWVDDSVLEVDTIARINHFTVVLDFAHGGLKATVNERSGLINGLALRGRAANRAAPRARA